MALQKFSISRFFKSRDACALFVADGLRQWAVGPATYALTTTIRPGKFGGFFVTFAIKGSSDDTAIQTFSSVLTSIYPPLGGDGLSRLNERNESEGERND